MDWLLREHRDLIDAGLILNPDAGGGMSSGNRRLYMGLETSEKSYVTFELEVWPGVPVVPDMDAGASDSTFTRAAGIPTFGITGIFTDIDDNRAHGKDERLSGI